MQDSYYITRETIIEVPRPSINDHSTTSHDTPRLSWEAFVLINVELERLSILSRTLMNENQALKASADRSIHLAVENENLKMDLLRATTELTVLKENKERVFELESKISSLVADSHSSSFLLSQKGQDAAEWKLKYEEMSQAANTFSNMHRTQVEQNEILLLKVNRLEHELAEAEAFKVQAKQIKDQLEALVNVRDNLNETIADKENENTELKEVLEDMKRELELLELEKQALQKPLGDSWIIIQDIEEKIKEIIGLVGPKDEKEGTRDTNGYLAILKEKVSGIVKEREELGRKMQEKDEEMEKILDENKQMITLTASMHKEIDKLKNEVYKLGQSEAELSQQRDDLQLLLSQKNVEIEDLANQIRVLSRRKCAHITEKGHKEKDDNELRVKMMRIEDTEKKLQALINEKKRLTQENNRLNATVTSKTKKQVQATNSGSKPRLMKMQSLNVYSSTSPKSAGQSQRGLMSFGELAGERVKELEEPRDQIPIPLDNQSGRSASQTPNKDSHVISEKDKVIANLSAKVLNYEKEIEELSEEKRGLVAEIEELLDNIETLTEKTGLNGENEPTMQTLIKEKARLVGLLTEKMKEIEAMKAQVKELQNAEQQQKLVNIRTKERNKRLTEKMENIEDIIGKLKEIESEVEDFALQARSMLVVSENEKLNLLLAQNILKIEEWKAKLSTIENTYTNAKQTKSQAAPPRRVLMKSHTAVLTEESLSITNDRVKLSYVRNYDNSPLTGDFTASPDNPPLFRSKLF